MATLQYTVLFASATKLSGTALAGIAATTKKLLKQGPIPVVVLESFASSGGDEQRNDALTVLRAEIVQKEMENGGYPAHKILVRARGEREFERPNQSNKNGPTRRVEIVQVE